MTERLPLSVSLAPSGSVAVSMRHGVILRVLPPLTFGAVPEGLTRADIGRALAEHLNAVAAGETPAAAPEIAVLYRDGANRLTLQNGYRINIEVPGSVVEDAEITAWEIAEAIAAGTQTATLLRLTEAFAETAQ